MNIDSCYKIGYILKPHGLKGEVTISIDAEIPNDFDTLNAVFIQQDDRLAPYIITSVSVRGAKAFVKFEDIDTPEAAQKISKHSIYLPKSTRPKSERGEFYDDEVLNFIVVDEQTGELGTINEVISAGPNRLLALNYQGKEVLIPINGPFISSINKSKRKITVNLPEGFLDI